MIPFWLPNSGHFSLFASFNQSIWDQYLSEFNIWFEETCNPQCPSNPTRYTSSSSSSDADWCLKWFKEAFYFLYKSFFTPYFFKCHFSMSATVLIKIESFLFFWAKNHREKHSPLSFFYFLLNCKAPKHQSDSYIKVFSNALQQSYKLSISAMSCVMWLGSFLIGILIWSSMIAVLGFPDQNFHFWI